MLGSYIERLDLDGKEFLNLPLFKTVYAKHIDKFLENDGYWSEDHPDSSLKDKVCFFFKGKASYLLEEKDKFHPIILISIRDNNLRHSKIYPSDSGMRKLLLENNSNFLFCKSPSEFLKKYSLDKTDNLDKFLKLFFKNVENYKKGETHLKFKLVDYNNKETNNIVIECGNDIKKEVMIEPEAYRKYFSSNKDLLEMLLFLFDETPSKIDKNRKIIGEVVVEDFKLSRKTHAILQLKINTTHPNGIDFCEALSEDFYSKINSTISKSSYFLAADISNGMDFNVQFTNEVYESIEKL